MMLLRECYTGSNSAVPYFLGRSLSAMPFSLIYMGMAVVPYFMTGLARYVPHTADTTTYHRADKAGFARSPACIPYLESSSQRVLLTACSWVDSRLVVSLSVWQLTVCRPRRPMDCLCRPPMQRRLRVRLVPAHLLPAHLRLSVHRLPQLLLLLQPRRRTRHV